VSIENKRNEVYLRIARLGLRLRAEEDDLQLISPPSYQEFLQPAVQPQAFFENGGIVNSQKENTELLLQVINEPIIGSVNPKTNLFSSDNWDIWIDENGSFFLEALRLPPARRVRIEADFSGGEIRGDFSGVDAGGVYPLENLDMKLFVNWLAGFGDLILHASGVAVDGKGYCFSGHAGIGKSTLAAALQKNHNLTVLGEDQVILRYLDGRFWAFGTPWHENPAMCSPHGVPLEKLFFLERNSTPGIIPLTPVDGTARILQNAFIPYYRQDLLPGILDHLELLTNQVPFFSLSYPLGSDPWQAILDA
jgi:hypothetical protein